MSVTEPRPWSATLGLASLILAGTGGDGATFGWTQKAYNRSTQQQIVAARRTPQRGRAIKKLSVAVGAAPTSVDL